MEFIHDAHHLREPRRKRMLLNISDIFLRGNSMCALLVSALMPFLTYASPPPGKSLMDCSPPYGSGLQQVRVVEDTHGHLLLLQDFRGRRLKPHPLTREDWARGEFRVFTETEFERHTFRRDENGWRSEYIFGDFEQPSIRIEGYADCD